MKFLVSSFILLFSLSQINAQTIAEYLVNKEISKVEWVGKKVTGSHEGTIKIKNGSVSLANNKISKGNLIIDMKTIEITDIADTKTNAKLKGHLISSDFFGVEEFPTASLKINEVKYLKDNKVELMCDLTIKEFTAKIMVPASVILEKNKLVVIGEVEIDRTKYDIRYGSGSFFDNLGDKAINDDFTIKFKVAAIK